MKIQLDTTNKTIKVEESVKLQELTDALEKLLPNGEWKEFKLETPDDYRRCPIVYNCIGCC